jgi:hypothetical protein
MFEELTTVIQTIAASCLVYVYFKWLNETERFVKLSAKDATMLSVGLYHVFMLVIGYLYNVYLPLRVTQLIVHTWTTNAIESFVQNKQQDMFLVFAIVLGLYANNFQIITTVLYIDSVFVVLRSITSNWLDVLMSNVQKILLYSYLCVYIPLYANFDMITMISLVLVNLSFHMDLDTPVMDRKPRIVTFTPPPPSLPPKIETPLLNFDLPLPTIKEEEEPFKPTFKALTIDDPLPPLETSEPIDLFSMPITQT